MRALDGSLSGGFAEEEERKRSGEWNGMGGRQNRGGAVVRAEPFDAVELDLEAPPSHRYGAQSAARSSSTASKGSARTTASPRKVATSSHPRSWRRSTSTLRSVGDTSHTCATPSRR